MAVKQLSDYLLCGNVKNSVNLPSLSLEKSAKVRVCAITKGDVSAHIAEALASSGIEVKNSASAVKKDVGYCVFDSDADITDDALEQLKAINGVIAIRII